MLYLNGDTVRRCCGCPLFRFPTPSDANFLVQGSRVAGTQCSSVPSNCQLVSKQIVLSSQPLHDAGNLHSDTRQLSPLPDALFNCVYTFRLDARGSSPGRFERCNGCEYFGVTQYFRCCRTWCSRCGLRFFWRPPTLGLFRLLRFTSLRPTRVLSTCSWPSSSSQRHQRQCCVCRSSSSSSVPHVKTPVLVLSNHFSVTAVCWYSY